VFLHDHATLLRSLRQGDFFLCASEAQRFFYLGLLLALSRLNPETFESDPSLDSLIAIVPFGVPPPRTIPSKTLAQPSALFGGIYDWYDPQLAIEAVRLARDRFPQLTLTFTEHPNAESTPQGVAAETRRVTRERGDEFVGFEPWVPYSERAHAYDRFTISLLTFGRSLETDLSMRTRIFDFLWGGLPVIASSARGTDEILGRYGAGVVVRATSPEPFAEAIVSVLSDEKWYERLLRGASEFTSEHQWEDLLGPLLSFCDAPRADAEKIRYVAEDIQAARPTSILARIRRKIGA